MRSSLKLLTLLIACVFLLSLGCSSQLSQSAAEQALEEQELEETAGDEDDSGQAVRGDEDS